MFAEATLTGEEGIHLEPHGEEIIGASPALKEVLRQVEVVAPTDATVLLQGETGVGKERFARAVHQHSARRDRPLVTVKCAAIPTGLLESELFGHERGAFTGALAQKLGRFELAHRGTLFLDEIGDLPLELQPKLLRVIQEQEFERVGSVRTQRVDVRLVAATHRDLAQLVEAGQFRADLYYRLNVFPITVPPLRQRSEDIPLLVRHFVRHYARQLRKRIDIIPAEAMAALTHYHWPGNVRELQNVIERAVILSPGLALRLALGHPFHPQFHADVWPGEFGVRLPHLRCPSLLPTHHNRTISHGMVSRISRFSIPHCVGHSQC
jgi:formate hydrogenlyase transcriptional activator